MAGAYTIFANNGLHHRPVDCWPACARPPATSLPISHPTSKQLLDPRVAYLTTDLMENVIDHGTRRGERALWASHRPPRARQGPSHDAWFAGYTSNLLCIVWVGNDDYTDIKIEGAHAAAADLGGVHEEGGAAAAILRHEDVLSRRRVCRWLPSTRTPICLPTQLAPMTSTLRFSTARRRRIPAIIRRTTATFCRSSLGWASRVN